jgi:hypothetical protein
MQVKGSAKFFLQILWILYLSEATQNGTIRITILYGTIG